MGVSKDINNQDVIDHYQIRLTPYAKVFYDEWLLDPHNAQYNILSADHLLFGTLDLEKLKKALKRYVVDHLLLNSHIKSVNGQPYWVKNNRVNVLDYSEEPIAQSALLAYVNRSFDLHNEPLYRLKLVRIKENVHRFIIVFHHLLMDGISLNVGLFEKLSSYYNDDDYSETLTLVDQISLIERLRNTVFSRLEKNTVMAETFWNYQLPDLEALDLRFLKISKRHPDLSRSLNPIKEIKFGFNDQETAKKLDEIKKTYKISPYFYGQCVFSIVLHRYTGQKKFGVCYPVAIKEGQDFIYGGQVNLNIIPYEINELTKITDLFNHIINFVDLTIKSDKKYGYHPITKIIQKNKSLLNVYFSQAYFREDSFQFDGVKKVKALRELSVDGVTQNMLLIENEPLTFSTNYRVKYDSRIFDKTFLIGFIARYKKVFLALLEDLTHKKEKLVYDYSLLTKEESEKILSLYNKNSAHRFSNSTIHGAFEEQVLKSPENTAIVYNNREISYRLLNEKSNQLANYLRKNYHIAADDFILLCLDKSDFLVIAILAVLKSSAAYVPIIDYPEERISYILNDTSPKAIITNKKYAHQFKDHANVMILEDQKFQDNIAQESIHNPTMEISGHNLSYIIYTSGTTGNPKGVMQQHDNLINLFTGAESLYHFTDMDVWVLFHSCVFDFSVWEIFGALLYGGKLIIPTEEDVGDNFLFYELCYRERITILNQTPTAFYPFMKIAVQYKHERYLSHLRCIIFGGESLNFSALSHWFEVYPDSKPCLSNMYGTTETTVVMTYRRIKKRDISGGSYIGRPLPGKNIYILDGQLCPVPIGAVGELYASGGVARGYLNQLALTQRSFISNPFDYTEHEADDNRLYSTGDLVRMLPDGDLEYIGRKDSQVKIRGYRIELAEIENRLKSHPFIEQAIIVVTHTHHTPPSQDQYLVAYYTATLELSSVALKEYITQQLPAYMCPSIFLQMDAFPLTINGKIDSKALPDPEFKSMKQYDPPASEQEKIVCNAFSIILHIDRIGVNDDFFDLGGNSIKVISLILILQKSFDIKVSDIFTLRTPKKIAKNKLVKNNLLESKLEKIKCFLKDNPSVPSYNAQSQEKMQQYLLEINRLKSNDFSLKPITSVLLTGSTGYLGCNILNQLLKLTAYNVYLLIRADSKQSAAQRIEEKFTFYFHKSLINQYRSRVFFIHGDIEKEHLGLNNEEYNVLASKIDSTIHSAALVKHHGCEDRFYSANVEATKRLLQFSSLTKLKDFHYISTISVAYFGTHMDEEQRIFTELDFPDYSENWSSVYNKTKFMGESQTMQWRKHGIKSNIYRIGNLAFMSRNCQVQENIEDNAFSNWLKFLVNIGCVTEKLINVQISPADATAQAIVKLFDKDRITNTTHHVFNPHLVNLLNLFKYNEIPIVNLPLDDFIDRVIDSLHAHNNCDLLGKFLLHQGWLESDDLIDKTNIKILQNKTECILNRLGFEWHSISSTLLNRYFFVFSKDAREEIA